MAQKKKAKKNPKKIANFVGELRKKKNTQKKVFFQKKAKTFSWLANFFFLGYALPPTSALALQICELFICQWLKGLGLTTLFEITPGHHEILSKILLSSLQIFSPEIFPFFFLKKYSFKKKKGQENKLASR